MGEKLAEIREAGYSLHLLLDCKRRGDEHKEEVSAAARSSASSASSEGTFRINAQDLAFLKSVGIDPTRRLSGRRRRDPR